MNTLNVILCLSCDSLVYQCQNLNFHTNDTNCVSCLFQNVDWAKSVASVLWLRYKIFINWLKFWHLICKGWPKLLINFYSYICTIHNGLRWWWWWRLQQISHVHLEQLIIREAFKKKIAEKETLVHSHLTPSLPSLNGTREMGT